MRSPPEASESMAWRVEPTSKMSAEGLCRLRDLFSRKLLFGFPVRECYTSVAPQTTKFPRALPRKISGVPPARSPRIPQPACFVQGTRYLGSRQSRPWSQGRAAFRDSEYTKECRLHDAVSRHPGGRNRSRKRQSPVSRRQQGTVDGFGIASG